MTRRNTMYNVVWHLHFTRFAKPMQDGAFWLLSIWLSLHLIQIRQFRMPKLAAKVPPPARKVNASRHTLTFLNLIPQKYRSHSHLMFSEVSRTNSIRKWEWTSCNTDNEVNFVWCYINFALPGSIISFFPFLAPQKIYISEMCQISHKRKWMMKFE